MKLEVVLHYLNIIYCILQQICCGFCEEYQVWPSSFVKKEITCNTEVENTKYTNIDKFYCISLTFFSLTFVLISVKL